MFLNLKSQYGNRRTSGFTLLELLLVVFIMSVLAFSAVSLTETMDSSQDQYRYERAKNQAAELKKAIIDRVETQQVVRGFVADVGALPANMTELAFGVIVEDGVADRKIPANILLTPRYGQTLGGGGQGNLDGELLVTTLESLNLWKGFRGTLLQTDEGTPRDFYRGSYLSNLLPGKNIYDGPDKPRFDDGWGNQNGLLNSVENDDLTHGWVWNNVVNDDLTLGTYGKDGALDGTEYAKDYLHLATISRDDWSVDPSAIQVELYNDLGNLNASDALDLYKFVILSYDATKNFWQTTSSNPFQIPQSEQVFTATFPAIFPRVPAGTHVLMLIKVVPGTTGTTPIIIKAEKIPGATGIPEVQTLVLSPPRLVKLTLRLPDLSGGPMTIEKTNEDYVPLADAITDLNSQFHDEGYDQNPPLSYGGNDLIIELNESSGMLIDNQDVDLIEVEPDSTVPVAYRAKHVHVLPGQPNIFRLNFSSIAP